MTAAPRDFLLVAFHYPPDNTSTGVLRTLKFSRHLVDHGWRARVVTVEPDVYQHTDPALLEQVPEQVTVDRLPCRDARDRWNIAGRYPSWIGIPDRFGSWRGQAVKRCVEIARDASVRAIYSTYPHPSAHLIALAVHRATGLPWIADYRDPWAGGAARDFAGLCDRFLERRVVLAATRTIANTDLSRENFLARYPELDPSRVVTITNGYDEADFVDLEPVHDGDGRFTLIYPGGIDPGNRNPIPVLEALALLVQRGDLQPEAFRLVMLGGGKALDAPWFRSEVDRLGLGDNIEGTHHRIPYHESLGRLKAADMLLVLNEPVGEARAAEVAFSRLMVPAKVYEYLRLQRPFLALCAEGSVPYTLDRIGAGWSCSPYDIEGIARYVMEAVRLRQEQRGIDVDAEALGRYERHALSERLAAVLDEVAGP